MSFHPLILYPRSDSRFPIQLTKKYPCGVGLTNQLFTLVNGVIRAKKNKQNHIVIDSFLADAITGIPIQVSRVIDLAKTQENIRRIPGFELICLYDRTQLANDLSVQFGRARHAMSWYTLHHKETFDGILRAIEYTEPLKEVARSLNCPKNISQVHLRLEHDMLTHLASHHKLDYNYVKGTLTAKYREGIRGHIPRGSEIFLMGHPDFLGLEHEYRFYNFNQVKPQLIEARLGTSGRELSAIVDYLIGRELTGVFVGSHRLSTHNGSSFSYYLLISLGRTEAVLPGSNTGGKQKKVLVDPDNLKNGLEIHN